MKKLSRVFIFGLVLSTVLSCEKRVFKHITVSGLLYDWYHDKSSSGTVTLGAETKNHEDELISIGSITVSDDGSFQKTFKAASSGNYKFTFSDGKSQPLYKANYIEDNESLDFGKIEMLHTFVCKVNLTYTSWRDVYIDFGTDIGFPPYTNTTYYDKKGFSKEQFAASRIYTLSYKILGPSIAEYKSISLPIGASDTVSVDISY